jgi:anti-sigma factor RsiW
MKDQNYQELVRKITMYLDNELSEQAERELLREIQSNPAYIKVLSQEKSFREFIRSKIHRRKPSPALIQSIKEKIRVNPIQASQQP